MNTKVRTMQVDNNLPKVEDGMRLDEWWTLIFRTGKYPCLSKVVKICLSIFTSPQVEQSFSQMNEIVTATTNRMETKTFAALQTVKYYLRTKEKPQRSKIQPSTNCPTTVHKEPVSLKIFRREDVRKDPVDSLICRHLRRAHQSYKDYLNSKTVQKQKDQEKSSCRANPAKSTTEKRKRLEGAPNKPNSSQKKLNTGKTY